MFRKLFPSVRAQEEEDLVDPQQTLKDKCSQLPKAVNLFAKYQECNDRVNSRKQTAETCAEELTDYLHVVDYCVAKDLFAKLK